MRMCLYRDRGGANATVEAVEECNVKNKGALPMIPK